MRSIYLTGLAIIASVVAMAQTGNITGKVATADGQPASYVTISIKELQTATLTDDEGIFRIAHLKPGTYTITASHIGLNTKEYAVEVAANANTSLSIELIETSRQLEQVTVKGKRGLNARPASVGKIAIDPMDLPQSISVVNASLIRNQQAQRLSDVIKNVNGVYLAGARASTQETFYARGYNLGSNNIFKNGTRINTGAMPEVSSLEKVEVLKGSAAILYGNVAPGGIINLVTKQPKFNWGGEISLRAGSYGLCKPAFDVYGPVGGGIAFRLNGTYESAESFRDVVTSERFYINPSLLFKIGKKTDLIIQGDYLHHRFTPDFGIGSIDNTTITPVSRNTFFGAPWQYAKTEQATAGFNVRHELNANWSLNITGSYQDYQRDYFSTERIQAAANGNWARPLGRTNTEENYYIAQADLNGKFNTGKIGHALLAGMDAERYLTTAYTYSFTAIYDTINLLDPKKYTARTDKPTATATRYTQTPVVRVGAYVQDLISISEKVKLLAGVRWSLQETRPIDTVFLASGKKNTGGGIITNKAFTPRVGVVYRPVTSTSLFASSANSFAVNNGTDVYGKALDPSMIDQFEIGVKNDFFKGDLSVNVTAYRIINNNLAQTAQFLADGVTPNNNTALKALTGETTSDGVELDIAGRPVKGLDVRAGYSYNYMRYTETPDAKGNFVEGERLVNSPAHTANATVFYSIKAFRFGVSYNYVGDRIGGWNNTIGQAQQYDRRIPVEAFSTVDVTAGYAFRKLSLLLKVSNLTNTYNYYVHENYSVNPIPPTQVLASVAYRF